MKRFSPLVCALLLAGISASAQQPITSGNWMTHPEIAEVRALYNSVNAAKISGKLKKSSRRFPYCEPYRDTERTLYTGRNGMPRLYSFRGGSDDSSVGMDIYYDEHGIRRFAYILAGAINGTTVEHRVYFTRSGKKLWEVRDELQGPGYSFPLEWPESEITTRPAQAFAEKNSCPDRK